MADREYLYDSKNIGRVWLLVNGTAAQVQVDRIGPALKAINYWGSVELTPTPTGWEGSERGIDVVIRHSNVVDAMIFKISTPTQIVDFDARRSRLGRNIMGLGSTVWGVTKDVAPYVAGFVVGSWLKRRFFK